MMRPSENDEDWGLGSDSDGADEPELLRAGGPLRCWQRAGLKRVAIDERRPPTVLPARYDAAPCCAVCGRRGPAESPLAPLFDNTSFVSMADVVRDTVGLEFAVSENPHENVVCGGCRGYVLALHTMRAWLCDLQKRFVRMVVHTNNGRRTAKIRIPKAYRGVDFYSREAAFLEMPAADGERLGAQGSVTRLGDGGGNASECGVEAAPEPGVTSEPVVDDQCGEQVVRNDPVTAEQGVNESEPAPEGVTAARDQSGMVSDSTSECVVQQLLGDAPAAVSGGDPPVGGGRPSETADEETQLTVLPPAQPLPLTPPAPAASLPQPVQQLPSLPPPPPLTSASQPLHATQPATSTPASQPLHVTQPATSTSPPTPPRPAAGSESELLDPFDQCSIGDLLVLRSPLAPRSAAAAPERPPPVKLKRIAPKMDGREAPPPPPIVLSIMPMSVPVSTPGSPSFKAIMPRRPGSNPVRAAAAPPPVTVQRVRRSLRRMVSSRESRRTRRTPADEPPPPPPPLQSQEPAGYTESMVFYNPDGSIPVPPYAGTGEYAQLQTVPPEPQTEYRQQPAFGVPQDEIDRYAADYGVYMEESIAPGQQHNQTQRQQPQQQPEPAPPAPVATVECSTITNVHEVALENGRDPSYKVLPRICKPCGAPLSCEMHMVRKHFVESHMSLERNDMTGSIVYRCRVCPAEHTSLETLKKHFSSRHVSRSAVVCGRCHEIFPRLEALQDHIRRRHHARPECSECGMTCLSSRALNIHLSKVHRLERRSPQQQQGPPEPLPPPMAGEVTVDSTG